MFSTPTPGSRTIAANALRNAGLIDRDTQMQDASDRPGGRKGPTRIRVHKARNKDPSGASSRARASETLAAHMSPTTDPLSIRGAARPTAAGRLRRNAVSAGSHLESSSWPPNARPPRPASGTRTKAVDQWRELVFKRWNPETRFLNLEAMIDDEVVKKSKLMPPGYGGSARDAAVIFKLASQLTPEVKTLSLARNNLSGQHLTYLNRYLPQLANLSLQNNNLRVWKDLDFLSGRREKLVHLRELILVGNPVRETEYQNGRGEAFRSEIARRFTSLEVLDQEAIAQISFDNPQSSSAPAVPKPSATTFPYEMEPSFITGVDSSLLSNFLVRFFEKFDTQRASLFDVYDPSCTFSFSANTSIPVRARLQGFQHSKEMPNQRKLEWGPWINGGDGGSRNLSRIAGGFQKTVESLHIGTEKTVKAMVNLPGTKHDLNGPPENYCIDSFPKAIATGGVRSFDRVFVLAIAPEGSRAKKNGWDVVILSDQLTVRGYCSPAAWKPGPMLVQAQPNPRRQLGNESSVVMADAQAQDNAVLMQSLPFDQQQILAAIPELQQNLVLELCRRTRLNVRFSIDCLTGNQWDMDKAVLNFEQVKATLPGGAYL
ncbi:hypothetical protein AMATHDRAFT_3332 [Amanita thiersii Skay4041]|uniref:TAP-C domain-containing protein n=1 Tax=Amanita thiersii Skay4041 TaxID=703135 RepID=A0A2A9NJ96_9AGAR|nr:hypothetical protein AMATHDRAFT_3332 [Amanita thiersii Skay4041]